MMTERRIVAIAIIVAIISAFIVIVSQHKAHGATCASRPGISKGKVWWRYRIDRNTGVRCWYPGSKHARARVRARPVALRMTRESHRSQVVVTSQPAELPPRPVQSLRLYHGFTASEHVQRRFDQLFIFPVVED